MNQDVKISESISEGESIRINFIRHGLGDCIMFYPLFKKLQRLFPKNTFSLYTSKGQEEFSEINSDHFDKEFNIEFYEWDSMFGIFKGMSKPEICAKYELGIPFDESDELSWKPKEILNLGVDIPKNSIGLAFQITSNPAWSLNEDLAEKIWSRVKYHGMTPIEVSFIHRFFNHNNQKFKFIDKSCRDLKASTQMAEHVISQLSGFIGVCTGTFVMATCILKEKPLFIRLHQSFVNYKKHDPVPELDLSNGEIDLNKLDEYIIKTKESNK